MSDIAMRIREWQAKAASGKLTREEMREAVIMLRAERKMSVEVGAIKKAKKAPTDTKALLDDFAKQMGEAE